MPELLKTVSIFCQGELETVADKGPETILPDGTEEVYFAEVIGQLIDALEYEIAVIVTGVSDIVIRRGLLRPAGYR